MAGVSEILSRFEAIYPSCPRPRIAQAPGRVNLIGEHTDYNRGLVLPMAIDLHCAVAAAPSGDDRLRIHSEELKQSAEWSIGEIAAPRRDWSDRIAGIAWALARRGVGIEGTDLLIKSNVPIGGGLSSSAALGVAAALALGGARDRSELAEIAYAAEAGFVGIPCGIMDQFVSANGKPGAAILLDCGSLEWREVALPRNLAIIAVDSMVKHQLGDSAYRVRVAECAEAARQLGVASLREATVGDLRKLDGILLRRARHVITENARVEAFVSAAGRGDLESIGRFAVESHVSLRDDYEVSSPELDFLVETALRLPGVFGARMTGGGFGGSTVNFIDQEASGEFRRALTAEYRKKWAKSPEIHVCVASEGVKQIFP